MTSEQIYEKIDDIAYVTDIIDEEKVRIFYSNGCLVIPHTNIDRLIGVPISTMRVKFCKGEVESLIGKTTQVASLFKGTQGYNNCLSEEQIATYIMFYSRLNFEESRSVCLKLLKFIKHVKQNNSFHKENEPAPSANDTSSEKNISHSDFTTISEICQELDKRINGDFLIAYNSLDREGQLAFELGRDYARFTDRRQK